MPNEIPDNYEHIDRIEIHMVTGEKLVLSGDDAYAWAEAVDWAIRRFHVEQYARYDKIKRDFIWRKE